MAVRDIILISVIVFVFAISFFVLKFTADTAIDALVAIPQINESAQVVETFEGTKDNVTSRLDYIVFTIFMALAIGIIITGWFIPAESIFTWIYIIVAVIATIISAFFSNFWQDVTALPVFGSALVDWPLTNFILVWMPINIAVVTFIAIIVIFAKPSFSR